MPKTGYITIVGRPNAGKSTLLNALIGEKVSAISHRPQTTQRTIPGILTDESRGYQMVFLDTPGVHEFTKEQFGSQKSHDIHERINSEAFASLHQADIVLRLLDPTRAYGSEDEKIDSLLEEIGKPIIRIETKQDLENKSYPQKGVDIRIDSTTRAGFGALLEKIFEFLPEGDFLYPPEYYTDQSMDLRITEVIREQLFLELGEEVPYACFVQVTQIEEKGGTPDKPHPMLSIQAYINVETESQKVIVIGKGGKKIGEIGLKSRIILEEIFGKKIFLALRVKVARNWRKDERVLNKVFPKK
ncbi:MAG: GTPase Era [Candidatus Altimarinota bacterium]